MQNLVAMETVCVSPSILRLLNYFCHRSLRYHDGWKGCFCRSQRYTLKSWRYDLGDMFSVYLGMKGWIVDQIV